MERPGNGWREELRAFVPDSVRRGRGQAAGLRVVAYGLGLWHGHERSGTGHAAGAWREKGLEQILLHVTPELLRTFCVCPAPRRMFAQHDSARPTLFLLCLRAPVSP